MPILPFLALAGGVGWLAFASPGRSARSPTRSGRDGRSCRSRADSRRADGSADHRQPQDRRAEARARLRPAVAGQGRRDRHRPPHRADQGAAPPARDRARLRHAAGPHPRQHAARAQRLQGQDQGGRRRPRPDLRQPADGHGPDGQARSPCPATTPPSRPSACPRPGSSPALRDEAELQGLLDHRSLDGDLDAPDRGAQGQRLRPPELRQRPVAAHRPQQGPAEARRGHRPRPDLGLRHPARAADAAHRAHLDPRPADHPRGHRRSRRRRPLARR